MKAGGSAAACARAALALLLVTVTSAPAVPAGDAPNLARRARATASESHEDLTPDEAIDGSRDSRWSAIPGHDRGVWFELSWAEPVRIAEVIIHQYDRYVMELDVRAWGETEEAWKTLAHLGEPRRRLPKVAIARFAAVETTRLRIGDITNGPSFTEVQVYDRWFAAYRRVVHLASDIDGRFIGIVTDPWGAGPSAGTDVELSGTAGAGAWRAFARSDENGMFAAPMPLGLRGDVEVRVKGPATPAPTEGTTETAPVHIPASRFQYGLTPIAADTDSIRLDGPWKFAPDPPKSFQDPGFDDRAWPAIQVPAHWEMQGFRSIDGVGGYRMRFAIPPADGRWKLRFDGVYSGAEVWVNGVRLAYHEGGATPFEVDVTDAAKPGENVLALRVTEHTPASDLLDQMSLYADYPLAGIIRKVILFRAPEIHIGAFAVETDFDDAFRDARLRARIAVVNESDRPFEGSVEVEVRGVAPGITQVRAGAWRRAEVAAQILVPAPRAWDAEHPNLYPLAIRLRGSDGIVQEVSHRIGFRKVEVRGTRILLNGRPIKLRGTCHHDIHPLMGRAVTPELTRRDLVLMKEANLNAVRTSHYPPIPELLDIADRLGLYVEDEAPFCWVRASDDLSLAPRIIQLTAELVARDRNHPSAIIWSLANESGFGFGFERSHDWIRRADPTRPTSAATSANLDLATLHNPLAISRIDENEGIDRPLLFDESLCIFQGIFNDAGEMWVDPGIRDSYIVPLREVFDRFQASRATQGSMIWCWADDLACVPNRGLEYGRGATRVHFVEPAYRLPGRGIAGDAPWGVVDGWRRPKPEFWHVKKLHSPVRIEEKPLPIPSEGSAIAVPVENRYDFTDLSELRIAWEIGGERGTASASIPPRSKGRIEIRPRGPVAPGDALALSFEDAAGRTVDAYRLRLAGPQPASDPIPRGSAPDLIIREDAALAGPSTRIIGDGFELAFDRGSGLLRRGVAGGEAVLLESPALHILASGSPLAPIPDRLRWRLRRLEIDRDGRDVRVAIRGTCDAFEGGYDIRITPDGELRTRAAFRYAGESFFAREIGLRFSVPRECDLFAWERDAEWSVYPDDHIGRPRGEARAFPERTGDLPPAWPWSLDPSPMGSNDFRSTKRNIRRTSIRYPMGPGVEVLSDGTQHARAMVETDRISVHVNGWYGGTGAGWWEWEHNYGKGRRIEKDATVEAECRLRLVARR
ncbi:MAG: hypothetical protein JXP34_00360 [Planctomycetes bacterium]|nr:hypothetical protein [Planctomycetota bacterium]